MNFKELNDEQISQIIHDEEILVHDLREQIKAMNERLLKHVKNLKGATEERDTRAISKLDAVNWDVVFNCEFGESEAIYNYRQKVLREHGLDASGRRSDTKQPIFKIRFRDGTDDEVNECVRKVEFIIQHLKIGDDQTKYLEVLGLNSDHQHGIYYFGLNSTNEWVLDQYLFGRSHRIVKFHNLNQALQHIRDISGVLETVEESDN